ncbi:MAG TPA: Re/Si-specific NAD(P)(+) transhydrogenase subunit alpha [Bacteroidota bacterium]
MRIAVPREIIPEETRVAIVPELIPMLTRDGHEVVVEAGAGLGAGFPDAAYAEAGATVIAGPDALYDKAQVIIKVRPPANHPASGKHESQLYPVGAVYIGFLSPLSNQQTIKTFVERHIDAFSVEYIPRITRAQSMDVLSSMSTVTGYKAVLLATEHMRKMIPLLMTAAGTIPPAAFFILGAGVSGLQAIATAKRLGARVEAFDPRPSAKEQVKSLGAAFVEMELPKDIETSGGYAREQPEEFLKREREVIGGRLPKTDVVICTAQIFGRKSPVLITEEMVRQMRPGSVIVDLAAEQGGNCELTRAGEIVEKHSVIVIGPVNLAARVPVDASRMYAKNITALFKHLFPKKDSVPDYSDEIIKGSCITRDGDIVNAQVKEAMD